MIPGLSEDIHQIKHWATSKLDYLEIADCHFNLPRVCADYSLYYPQGLLRAQLFQSFRSEYPHEIKTKSYHSLMQ